MIRRRSLSSTPSISQQSESMPKSRFILYDFRSREELSDQPNDLCSIKFDEEPLDHIGDPDRTQRGRTREMASRPGQIGALTSGTRGPRRHRRMEQPVRDLRRCFAQSDEDRQIRSRQKLQSLILHHSVRSLHSDHRTVCSSTIHDSNL